MSVSARRLTRAWAWLVGLSLAGTAAAALVETGAGAMTAGVAMLCAALAKARLILLAYLGLAEAPSWRGGFVAVLALFTALLAVLYLAPARVG